MDYQTLITYGSFYSLDLTMDAPSFVAWTEENFEYVQYNRRKPINRYGLSVTSLDGGVSGIPDLDSLGEYNKENNTQYTERDFATPTPVYEKCKEIFEPWKEHIHRTHILKLGTGGFFPPHRDHCLIQNSFRLIVPLQNCNPPYFNFMLDNKLLHWEHGRMYFMDTVKMHYLFNSSFNPSYMLVANVDTNEESVKAVLTHLNQR